MTSKSLLKRIGVIEKFTEKGFLLHGSTKKLKILMPFKPSDYRLYIGNFKAVYASDKLSFAAMKAFMSSSTHSQTCYIYICKPGFFTEACDHHFISLGSVVPDYRIP